MNDSKTPKPQKLPKGAFGADTQDQLESALEKARNSQRNKDISWWAEAATFVIGAYYLLTSDIMGSFWVVPALVLLWLAMKIAKYVVLFCLTYVDDIVSGPRSVTRIKEKRTNSVPRPNGLRVVADLQVIAAELKQPLAAQAVEHGGKAGTNNKIADLPPGVIVFTDEGLAFFPHGERIADLTGKTKNFAYGLAKAASPHLSVAGAMGLDQAFKEQELQLPRWLREAREDEQYFVVPWLELVTASQDPETGAVRLTRGREGGSTETYILYANEDGWPDIFMLWRLHKESQAVLKEYFRIPRARELLPELQEKFATIYGERVDEHSDELYAELSRRIQDEVEALDDAQTNAILFEHMKTTLPYYAKIPFVVKTHPGMFEGQSLQTKEAGAVIETKT